MDQGVQRRPDALGVLVAVANPGEASADVEYEPTTWSKNLLDSGEHRTDVGLPDRAVAHNSVGWTGHVVGQVFGRGGNPGQARVGQSAAADALHGGGEVQRDDLSLHGDKREDRLRGRASTAAQIDHQAAAGETGAVGKVSAGGSVHREITGEGGVRLGGGVLVPADYGIQGRHRGISLPRCRARLYADGALTSRAGGQKSELWTAAAGDA